MASESRNRALNDDPIQNGKFSTEMLKKRTPDMVKSIKRSNYQ